MHRKVGLLHRRKPGLQAVDGVGAGGRGRGDAMKDCSGTVRGAEVGGQDSRDVLQDRSSCVRDETGTGGRSWRRKLLMASGQDDGAVQREVRGVGAVGGGDDGSVAMRRGSGEEF